MRVLAASYENFRNLSLSRLEPDALHTFLTGANGQGKSNLLEGIGLLTAFRSFRNADLRTLSRHGGNSFRICLDVSLDDGREHRIDLGSAPGAPRTIAVDRNRCSRLGDYIGRFPTVVCSDDDLQLLRGSPGLRRRSFDLFYSTLEPVYLESLRDYHRALQERNAQLRIGDNPAMLEAFEAGLAKAGATVIQLRHSLTASFASHFRLRYAAISGVDEEPSIRWEASLSSPSATELRDTWRSQRPRDLATGTTNKGPHRDDFAFRLGGHPARDFASDGQQRNLVLAFRLAQFDILRETRRECPVLLADDILGTLDARRRHAFWTSVAPEAQIIATGTELPDSPPSLQWVRYEVRSGEVAPF